MMTMILKSGYGLFHKNKNSLLGVDSESDNSGESIGTYYTLSYNQDPIWMVKNKLIASYVRVFSTEWYNAGYETPINPYEPEELDVVKIEVRCEIEEPYPVPTFEEYMNKRYNTKGEKSYAPDWYEYIMKEHKPLGKFGHYSLYDLQDLVGEY